MSEAQQLKPGGKRELVTGERTEVFDWMKHLSEATSCNCYVMLVSTW